MTPTATTKTIADCEATCIPFPGYPNGVELFARVLGAGKPAVAALGELPELFTHWPPVQDD